MDQTTTGLLLLCSCCAIPWIMGAVMAWWMRPRWQNYRWLGFLPGFIRDWMQRRSIDG